MNNFHVILKVLLDALWGTVHIIVSNININIATTSFIAMLHVNKFFTVTTTILRKERWTISANIFVVLLYSPFPCRPASSALIAQLVRACP